MTLDDLKIEIQKYQYIEDLNIIDVALASIIATRLRLGDPVWMILIGASSGGKSQILRPLALTDAKFMHRIDDMTENTFLSGAPAGKGEPSLLSRIGTHGMIVISDLTVIFSKQAEIMNSILSQFRMIYDGEMTKYVGTRPEPLHWKGSLGILAGSTPSIYAAFERVSDMGERFIYYRMKDYDARKATRLALGRTLFGKALDDVLGALYEEYLKDIVANGDVTREISDLVKERIIRVATLAEKIRTPVHMDWKGDKISRVPVPAFPMRIAQQLIAVARGLQVMRGRELDENDMKVLDWCCYSLANEEKRAAIRIICEAPIGVSVTTSIVADRIGLDTSVVRNVLQNLSAVGVLERSGGGDGLAWKIKDVDDYELLRDINGIKITSTLFSRQLSSEEKEEIEEVADHALSSFIPD